MSIIPWIKLYFHCLSRTLHLKEDHRMVEEYTYGRLIKLSCKCGKVVKEGS